MGQILYTCEKPMSRGETLETPLKPACLFPLPVIRKLLD